MALIGSPGSGKSSVARELSALMGLPLMDVDDDLLEKKWGMSVAEKLRQLGDEAFIEEEGQQLKGIRGIQRHVLSLSGSQHHHSDRQH